MILHVKLNEETHVPKLLQVTSVLDLLTVKHEQHLLVEVFFWQRLRRVATVHTCSAGLSLMILFRLKLQKLLLTFHEQQVLEVHLLVILFGKLLEQ